MAESKRKLPDYQKVDGFTIAGPFFPDALRDTINFKPRPGDIFVATFPKCGTTWTQQILYLIKSGGKPPVKASDVFNTCPFLEMYGIEVAEKLTHPRCLKIHLPFNLTPYSSSAKYIVVVRNPKDTLVSFFHHTRSVYYDFQDGDFNDYFEIFLNGENDFGDYFDHVLSWYEHRNDDNVLFLYFEKMKSDHRGAAVQIAKFLGPEYEEFVKDETVLNDIVEYSSLDYMKKTTNDALDVLTLEGVSFESVPKAMQFWLNYLKENRKSVSNDLMIIRKGIIGDWRNNFTPDQNKRMNEKIEDRLKGTEMLEYWNSIGCLE